MKNIRIGYFNLLENDFLSSHVVDGNFLNLLKRYIKIVVIQVKRRIDIVESFKKIEKLNLDYVYVNSPNFLLEMFLLRERYGINIAFIFVLHTVYPWAEQYIYLIPLLRDYDIICAPSLYARESFRRITDKFNPHIIPHFLDIAFIRKHLKPKSNKKRKVITFLGRLKEEKGVGVIIKCMPNILEKIRNVDLNIIGPLSGEGLRDYPKSDYVKSLERLVEKLKLTKYVHFKGLRLDLDKFNLLSESDILLNPTYSKEETFAVVNIEALACAVPVIATDWAGNKEIIKDGMNGFLVDVDCTNKKVFVDRKKLTSLVIEVLKNKQFRKTIAKNAYNSSLCYDYRKIIPRFVDLLKNKKEFKNINKWELIKNKRVVDYRQVFNKDILFFIFLDDKFKKETYSVLFARLIQGKARIERVSNKSIRNKKLSKKIEQDFSDYLLLKR